MLPCIILHFISLNKERYPLCTVIICTINHTGTKDRFNHVEKIQDFMNHTLVINIKFMNSKHRPQKL